MLKGITYLQKEIAKLEKQLALRLDQIAATNKVLGEAEATNKRVKGELAEAERKVGLLKTAAYFAEMIIADHAERNYGHMKEWISKFNDLELDWPIKDSGILVTNKRQREALDRAQNVVNRQADDYGLWFKAVTAAEAYLQQELRRLHEAVEGKSQRVCARTALEE